MSMNPTAELEDTQQALFALDKLREACEAELRNQIGVTPNPDERVILQNINLLDSILRKGYAKSDALVKKVYAEAHKDEKIIWKYSSQSTDGYRYEYTYTQNIGEQRYQKANMNVQKADEDLRQLGRANNIDLALFFRSFKAQKNPLSSEQLQSASEEFREHYKTSFIERKERPVDFWMDIPYYFELKSFPSLKNQMMKVLESKRENLTVKFMGKGKVEKKEDDLDASFHQKEINFYSQYYTRLCYPPEIIKTFIDVIESYYTGYKEIRSSGCSYYKTQGIKGGILWGAAFSVCFAALGIMPVIVEIADDEASHTLCKFCEALFFGAIPLYWLSFILAVKKWKEQSEECKKLLDQSEVELDQKLNEFAPRLGLPYEEMDVAVQNQVPVTVQNEKEIDEKLPLLAI